MENRILCLVCDYTPSRRVDVGNTVSEIPKKTPVKLSEKAIFQRKTFPPILSRGRNTDLNAQKTVRIPRKARNGLVRAARGLVVSRQLH